MIDKILETTKTQALDRVIIQSKAENYASKERYKYCEEGVNGTFSKVLDLMEESIKKAYLAGYNDALNKQEKNYERRIY